MKKNYPTIMIDRNRREGSTLRDHDYIVCLDAEAGFVARAMVLPRAGLDELAQRLGAIDGGEALADIYLFRDGKVGIAIVIEEFIHVVDLDERIMNRVKSLLKRCMKKYLHSETLADLAVVAPTIDATSTATPYSDFWWAENHLCPEHNGYEVIFKTSEPRVAIRFKFDEIHTTFEEFYKNIATIDWMGSTPSPSEKKQLMFNAWNYLTLEEAILDNDLERMEADFN